MLKSEENKIKTEESFNLEMSEKCYANARKSCKHGCLVNQNGCYVIPNNIWATNQLKFIRCRQSYDDFEKDKLMKEALNQKLREKQIETVKGHVRLEFTVPFKSDDYLMSRKQNYTLCESCYVIFNNHRCKLYLFNILIYSIIIFIKACEHGTSGKKT